MDDTEVYMSAISKQMKKANKIMKSTIFFVRCQFEEPKTEARSALLHLPHFCLAYSQPFSSILRSSIEVRCLGFVSSGI
jgi:hypothetical protein